MKIRSKLLVALTATVFGIVGCQRSDMMVEPDGTEIQFSPYIGKSTTITKGTPLTAFADGDRFNLFAFNSVTSDAFFNNITVTKSGTNWTYNPIKVWPKDNLNFYAYSPVGNPNATANITAATQSFQLTVPKNVEQHVDLVAAVSLQLSKVDVPLTFKHLTSRVSFKAKKDVTDPVKHKVRINSLKLDDVLAGGGLIADGSYAITDPTVSPMGTWTVGATKEVYAPELTHATSIDLPSNVESITKDNQSMFLIPQTLTGKELVVDYEYSVDGGFAWTKYIAHIDLEAALATGFEEGKHHVLNLSLQPSKTYAFTTTIEPWTDEIAGFVPTSPLSTDAIVTEGTSSIERFVVTDASKAGYTIKSNSGWIKIGSRSTLSFADPAVLTSFTYVDGMTKAVGDVSDPAQDWYAYMAPNPGATSRTGSITITFPNLPQATIQVTQRGVAKADNPIKASNSAVRIYSAGNSTFSALELFKLSSTDATKTNGATITVPNHVTVSSPVSPFDITATETPVVANIAAAFSNGKIGIQTADYQTTVSVVWSKNASLAKLASSRAIAGNYVKAEIVNAGVSTWAQLTTDGVNLTNKSAALTLTTPTAIFLVVDENATSTERLVAVKLTDAAGTVTLDYYTQDPSTVQILPIKSDVGAVYYYGTFAYQQQIVVLTSESDFNTSGFNISPTGTFGFNSGGGNWKPTAAGQTRPLTVQLTHAIPSDNFITISSPGYSSEIITVKFGTPIAVQGGKVFIPGSYSSASVQSGDATVSNDQATPGSGTLTVTNADGVWVHYAASTGAVRSSTISLTNNTDWRKSARVIVYQDARTVNHTTDYTDLAHPVKWAGSNIYINEAGIPAFDDVNVTAHSKYQGVLFPWGGLTALQPTGGSTPVVPNGIVWKPSEYTGPIQLVNSQPQMGASNATVYPQVTIIHHNPANAKGDICRYMTEQGLAPAGKKWRLPTAMELSRTAQKGLSAIYPFSAANPIPSSWNSDGSTNNPGARDLGRGVIESGIIMGGTFFPAGGFKNGVMNFVNPVHKLVNYWTSCNTSLDYTNAALFKYDLTLQIPQETTEGPYLDPWFAGRMSPIRCVVDEDNLY